MVIFIEGIAAEVSEPALIWTATSESAVEPAAQIVALVAVGAAP